MLATSAEDAYLCKGLKCGASRCVLKNLQPDELFNCMDGLACGEAPLSRHLSARLLREFSRHAAALEERDARLAGCAPGPELTARQRGCWSWSPTA